MKKALAAITIPGALLSGWLEVALRADNVSAPPTSSGCTTERRSHVNDIHATMLWALGLNHFNVTYMHNGRAERPTVVAGEVIKEVFA